MSTELLTIAAVLGIYVITIVGPGADFMLVSRLALAGQKRAAFGAVFGFATGATFYATLTMAGLTVLITEINWLARAMQIGGGLYLLYLGIAAWRAADAPLSAQETQSAASAFQGFRTGLLVNLSNPKGIAFFIGLYAAAIPPETSLWARGVILGGGLVIEIVWFGLVAILLTQAGPRRLYARFAGWLERIVGAVLAAFGLKLIANI